MGLVVVGMVLVSVGVFLFGVGVCLRCGFVVVLLWDVGEGDLLLFMCL